MSCQMAYATARYWNIRNLPRLSTTSQGDGATSVLSSSYDGGYEPSRAVVYASCVAMHVALLSSDFLSTPTRRIHCRPEPSEVERCMKILNQRADTNWHAKVRIRDRATFMGNYQRQRCNWKWIAGQGDPIQDSNRGIMRCPDSPAA